LTTTFSIVGPKREISANELNNRQQSP